MSRENEQAGDMMWEAIGQDVQQDWAIWEAAHVAGTGRWLAGLARAVATDIYAGHRPFAEPHSPHLR